jgi:hypothetical protein
LPQEEQAALIDPKGNHKQQPQETKAADTPTTIDLTYENAKSASPRPKQSSPTKQVDNEENDAVRSFLVQFICSSFLF